MHTLVHPTGRFQCPQCAANFRRAQHLQRHISSHETARPFCCPFCDGVFARRDTLNRHLKTCKARLESGSSIPSFPYKTRGKKRKACDRCMKMKRACDGSLPCETCVAKSQDCHYTDSNGAVSDERIEVDLNGMPINATESAPPGQLQVARRSQISRLDTQGYSLSHMQLDLPDQLTPNAHTPRDRAKFQFLVFVANGHGLCDSFGGRFVAGHGPPIPETFITNPRDPVQYAGDGGGSIRTSLPSYGQIVPAWHSTVDNMLFPQTQAVDTTVDPSLNQWPIHPLSFKAQDIVNKIRTAVLHRPRRSSIEIEWSPLMEMICFDFFAPQNLSRLLEDFWVSWYPHTPIIHKPTFDSTAASPLLIASMALVGASFSMNPTDTQNAKVWADAIEESLFDDEFLLYEGGELQDLQDSDRDLRKLESLQAAFLLCLFQNWDGSEQAMERLRRRRYSAVVALTRDMKPASVVHQDFRALEAPSQLAWTSFITTETKIRTISYIYLLDTAFVLFYNIPARLFSAEMEMYINSPEPVFQAESADAWFSNVKQWMKETPSYPMTLAALVEGICQPKLELSKQRVYSHLTMLNLFMIISSLGSTILHLRNSLAPSLAAYRNIEYGMANWKHAWDQMSLMLRNTPCQGQEPHAFGGEMWRHEGFMKSAWEYWLLCTVMMRCIRAEYGKGSSARRTLGKFDQHRMGQLKELISQFNDMSVA